jgi:Kef-type K+ transport system membrane component KefB
VAWHAGGGLCERTESPLLTQNVLLDLAVILVVVQICGFLCGLVGQSWVIGEVLAGIALGPSLFGALFPSVSADVFPHSVLPTLQTLGDIGLVLYMFTVGVGLDTDHMLRQSRRAAAISASSTLIPLAMGAALAYILYSSAGYAGPHATNRGTFMLLVGTAMSITAFPVLARILVDRGMAGSRIGTLALTCASIADILAWCLLALVVALADSAGAAKAAGQVLETLAFIGFMLIAVRPFIARAEPLISSPRLRLALIVTLLWLAATTTAAIGIHPIFGAFLLGVVTPRSTMISDYVKSIDSVNSVSFLPLFFIFSGLQTRIGLIDSSELWLVCLGVLLVAVIGKLLCCALAMRATGARWRDSFALGVLMNTRGLVELIVLNVGLADGILSPRFFSMLVIMALVTTMMASPLLSLLGYATVSRHE